MEQVLISPYFRFFVVPLFAVVFSIFLKTVSRNDTHKAFKKEDLAVGMEIAVTSLIMFITYCVTMADKIIAYSGDTSKANEIDLLKTKFIMVPWVLTFFILGLWGTSTLVRKLGWKDENNLHVFVGILAPFLFGMLCLIFVVNWIN